MIHVEQQCLVGVVMSGCLYVHVHTVTCCKPQMFFYIIMYFIVHVNIMSPASKSLKPQSDMVLKPALFTVDKEKAVKATKECVGVHV